MLLPVTDTYLEQRVNNLFNSYGTKLIVEDYVDLFFNCNLRKSNSGTEKGSVSTITFPHFPDILILVLNFSLDTEI